MKNTSNTGSPHMDKNQVISHTMISRAVSNWKWLNGTTCKRCNDEEETAYV
jgi:hypothetical protein